MSLGPIIIDLEGTVLTAEERERLIHPQAGGAVLFTRNFQSPEQLDSLVRELHGLRDPQLIVTVDHEGGRVQRFHEGFTRLPPAGVLGERYDRNPREGLALAEQSGWVMAAELRTLGVDLSFAPVLDLNRGISGVIGDRAYHRDPEVVSELARAVMRGMKSAGMSAVGKHFPGHGAVREDSHLTLPVDHRPLEDILAEDIVPFERMVYYGIAGMMPAHVVFDRVDSRPAGFSRFWLQEILRQRLGFQGIIISDDLSMAGAESMGDFGDRTRAALEAGCDMVLICNHPEGAAQALERLEGYNNPASQLRLARLHGRGGLATGELRANDHWRQASARLSSLVDSPDLELDV
jgi:beta-N-acetylhexosaminidase